MVGCFSYNCVSPFTSLARACLPASGSLLHSYPVRSPVMHVAGEPSIPARTCTKVSAAHGVAVMLFLVASACCCLGAVETLVSLRGG